MEAPELNSPPQPNVLGDPVAAKHILVLYTGGTMGMTRGANGLLSPHKGYLTEQIKTMREFNEAGMPEVTVIEFEHLQDSADFDPSDWAAIAGQIERHYFNYDGFVVIMGTDTMAYTASALSFMLENLAKPVIITGSQIPFSAVYNDARRNLIMSVLLCAQGTFTEVCIFFDDRLLRGNRAIKQHSFSLDAFQSPNLPPLATIGVNIENNLGLGLPQPRAAFRACMALEANIIVVRLIPGFSDEALQSIIRESTNLKAIVFEVYGAGNMPNKRQGLLKAIEEANKRDILIVAVTQCVTGSVVLDQYAVGEAMTNSGVVSAGDMTLEATVTKLSYLFAKPYLDAAGVKRLLLVPLRGELSPPERFEARVTGMGNLANKARL
eukprot:CAMPEP_0118879900 /NCGR_PEP_ID=MMETSP1163-20130328/19576_1 /TAXON_ID=124430 /ORGANISM="Phaeomonas parva, Strain CCMP2877" /LENGTH=379 /DNA_ID=CAMNT_0006816147 /DNA_START=288 /DNA_END=1427 /DNA_ORIENTATION=-